MDKIELTLPFFSIEQPGGVFYYTRIQTNKLKDRLIVRNRSRQEDGVQRDLNKKRSSEISEYLDLADAVIPTPLVISVDSKNIKILDDNTLSFSSNESGIFGEIIDGQHRYEGLKRSISFSEYPVPICIFIELSLEDKASIFSTINSTQVKVPKSYIYDLFDYTEENTPIKFCHDVCKTLNYESSGPLFKKIKMLGKKLNDEEILSQAAFIDAILPLITNNQKKDSISIKNQERPQEANDLPLRNLYINKDILVFSKIISNYMSAVRSISAEKWEEYVLRSIGIKVFAKVLGHLAPIGVKNSTLSEDFFYRQLERIKPEILACTTSDGTNKGVENRTVEKLISGLS